MNLLSGESAHEINELCTNPFRWSVYHLNGLAH